jgi:hypothetical protein
MHTLGETTGAPPTDARAGTTLRALLTAGALVLFALLVAQATRAFGPDAAVSPEYNSDNGVPVLMSNADEWNLFHFYYYGQDRFGAWPFLLARAVGKALGAQVMPEHLHAWLTAWLLAGAFVVAALARGFRLLAAGLYLAVVVAIPSLSYVLFELAQVYPWQLTALLLAWWSVRRHNDSVAALAADEAPSRRALFGGRARTFLLSFLAIWTSTVSGPLLVLVAGVEALRTKLLAPEHFPAKRALRRWGEAVLLIGAAYVVETIIRGRYHSFSKRHYGLRYRTNLGIDFAHLGDNARAILGQVWNAQALPLLLAGTVGALAAAVLAWRRLRNPAASEPREPVLLEGALLVLGAWVLGAAHLPLLIVLNHVRVNEYHSRYFTPLFLFGAFAGALSLALAVSLVPALARLRPRVLAGVGAASLAGAAWALPAPQPNPSMEELRRTAERLAQRRPGVYLLGGYWDTYLWPSLQREGALVPVPHEADYQRTVWWSRGLSKQSQVLVGHTHFPGSGTAEAPAPWLFQHSTLLQLEQPRWDAGAGRTFSLYRNALPVGQPHTTEPGLSEWKACDYGASLTLSFSPRAEALVFAVLSGTKAPVTLTAEPLVVEGSGPAPAPRVLLANERLHWGLLEGGGALLRGVRLTAAPGGASPGKEDTCRGEATFVLNPAISAR